MDKVIFFAYMANVSNCQSDRHQDSYNISWEFTTGCLHERIFLIHCCKRLLLLTIEGYRIMMVKAHLFELCDDFD